MRSGELTKRSSRIGFGKERGRVEMVEHFVLQFEGPALAGSISPLFFLLFSPLEALFVPALATRSRDGKPPSAPPFPNHFFASS
jgi:hypothetical protein